MNAGKHEARKVGRRTAGRVPYGYRRTSEGQLRVVESEAEVVRTIFAKARSGIGPGSIATELNAQQIPRPTGRPWNFEAVRYILRNQLYAGEMHGIKGAQPAIVSRRLWNQVQ